MYSSLTPPFEILNISSLYVPHHMVMEDVADAAHMYGVEESILEAVIPCLDVV